MKDAIGYAFTGLGSGGFIAMMAIGLVIAFKGSGVINFAHGAVAMYVAYQFHYLRETGVFRLPWADILPTKSLNIPIRISLTGGDRMNLWLAMLLSLLTAVMLGALMHYLVFKPLRNAAPLGRVIGAIGVMIYLQGIALVIFPSDNPQPEAVLFPDSLIDNFLGFGLPLPGESLALAIVAILLGTGLWVFYKFSRVGLATRAAAGNEKGAVLLGYSPDRLALYNWILSAVVAGFGGIVVGSITGALAVPKFTGVVVPALGAALIGSLSSIPLAVVGGLAIGVIQALCGTWMTGESWFPLWLQSGVVDAVPLVVIVVVLFLRGRSLPVRGNIAEKRLPLAPYPKRIGKYVAIFVPIGVIIAYGLPGNFIYSGLSGKFGLSFTTSLVAAMLMLTFVLLSGYLGQISLVQLSMAGVAAFVMARLLSNGNPTPEDPFAISGPGLPWPIAAILGITVATIVGVILGIPALRIRGVQLAVVTIAAAISLQTLYFDNVELTKLMAGSSYNVKPPTFFGINIGPSKDGGLPDNPNFAVFCLVVLAAMCVIVANLRRGSTGRRFLSVRANERAAASAGIDVARTKLLAFGIASALAGMAGCMMAFQQQNISSANWMYFNGLSFLAFAYLGGITSINGALLAGALTTAGVVAVFGSHQSEGLHSYTVTLGGVGMILTAILHPSGQSMLYQPLVQYFGSWLKRARGHEWAGVGRRLGPYIIIGLAWGAIGINPWRTDDWKRGWMMALGVFLALFIRNLVVLIRSGGHRELGSVEAAQEVAA